MDSNDRDKAWLEHIHSEQRREARRADEAYDERHRKIDIGFLELHCADTEVDGARRQVHSSRVRQAAEVVTVCEIDVDNVLEKLKSLPDEPERRWSPLAHGSNADVRRKAHDWSKHFDAIRLSSDTRTRVTTDRINELGADVNRYRFPSRPFATNLARDSCLFGVPESAEARELLLELASKIRWLVQYHLELDSAILRMDYPPSEGRI